MKPLLLTGTLILAFILLIALLVFASFVQAFGFEQAIVVITLGLPI